MGAATTLGGLFGVGIISAKAAAISFRVSTAISFGVGVGSYALDKATSGDEINIGEMFMHGGATALQSALNFGIGVCFGAAGKWDTLGQGVFGKFKNEMKEVGYNWIKRFFGAGAMYFKTTYKDMITRMIIRSGFNKFYDMLEALIY